MTTINASITISRNSRDTIRIRVKDDASRIQFIDVKMTPHDFAMAITGLSEIEVQADVHGLEHVGKTRVTEPRTAVCPLNTYDKDALRQWLKDNCQEPGWMLDDYIDSQGSVTWGKDNATIRYRVYRYEAPPQEKTNASA